MQSIPALSACLVGIAAACGIATSAAAAVITPTSYVYVTGPHPNYADTGGTEATDGLLAVDSFSTPGASDWSRYFGFRNADGKMTFTFSGSVNIDKVTIWAADDDGHVGVSLARSFGFTMGGSTVTRSVTNPAGTGVRELIFSGLGLSGSSLTLTANRSTEWTMLTEVRFEDASTGTTSTNNAPEPSGLALVGLGMAGLLAARRSGRRA